MKKIKEDIEKDFNEEVDKTKILGKLLEAGFTFEELNFEYFADVFKNLIYYVLDEAEAKAIKELINNGFNIIYSRRDPKLKFLDIKVKFNPSKTLDTNEMYEEFKEQSSKLYSIEKEISKKYPLINCLINFDFSQMKGGEHE